MTKAFVPKPSAGSSAANEFEALVRKCESEGCVNPILAAVSRNPKLYGAYRESFIAPPTSAARPSAAPNADVALYDKIMLSVPPEKRAARLAKMAADSPRIYNAAREALRF